VRAVHPDHSSTTQAREEGYFRIEWNSPRSARWHRLRRAFILPVVIDDTREPDALVPDRFRMVQWTRCATAKCRPTCAPVS